MYFVRYQFLVGTFVSSPVVRVPFVGTAVRRDGDWSSSWWTILAVFSQSLTRSLIPLVGLEHDSSPVHFQVVALTKMHRP